MRTETARHVRQHQRTFCITLLLFMYIILLKNKIQFWVTNGLSSFLIYVAGPRWRDMLADYCSLFSSRNKEQNNVFTLAALSEFIHNQTGFFSLPLGHYQYRAILDNSTSKGAIPHSIKPLFHEEYQP